MIKQCNSNSQQYMSNKMQDFSAWRFLIYGASRKTFKSWAKAIFFICLKILETCRLNNKSLNPKDCSKFSILWIINCTYGSLQYTAVWWSEQWHSLTFFFFFVKSSWNHTITMWLRWRLKPLIGCFSLKIYGNCQLETVLGCPFSLESSN